MTDVLFLLLLSFAMAGMIFWAFKRLPDEGWQFIASVPIVKDSGGCWHGLNFTYYGLFTANAAVFGAAVLMVLFGSVGIGLSVTLAIATALMLVCLPAARWVAQIVEGKACTFTIAGAFFVGIVTAPAVIQAANLMLPKVGITPLPVIPVLAALMIAYAFGEGLGRLACISFGCCYGISVADAPPLFRRLFVKRHFVFRGDMKKISYASGLEGKEVVPIQALTCVLFSVTALGGTLLFLRGRFAAALIATLVITQGWRAFSETLRADYRGEGRFSAYQVMGILGILVTLAVSYYAPAAATAAPNLNTGLERVWHPAVVLSLQLLWLLVFVMFGKSMVTGAEIAFHLRHDRI